MGKVIIEKLDVNEKQIDVRVNGKKSPVQIERSTVSIHVEKDDRVCISIHPRKNIVLMILKSVSSLINGIPNNGLANLLKREKINYVVSDEVVVIDYKKLSQKNAHVPYKYIVEHDTLIGIFIMCIVLVVGVLFLWYLMNM